MSAFAAATASALAALEVHPPTGFTWFGEPDEDPSAHTLSANDAISYLIHRLTLRLYSDFYVHGTARPSPSYRPARFDVESDQAFLHRLRQANTSSASQQSGWMLVEVDAAAGVVVTRDRLSLWLRHNDVLHPPAPWRPGTEVTIRFPVELLKLSPGYYSVLGEQELPLNTDTLLTRVYWNLDPGGAAALVAALTERLNDRRVPFRLKVGDRPERYDRADAGVLYVPKNRWHEVADVLPAVHATLRAHLGEETPAYTKPLADGVAVAEDAGAGSSFGMSRCSLLAAAAIQASATGAAALADRVAVVRAQFADRGLDPERAHLCPSSDDCYAPWIGR